MALRRYRSSGIYGGRTTEYSGRRIDRDTRTKRQIEADEAAFMAEMDAIVPLPNHHRCEDARCFCWHAGPCCSTCLPF